MATEDIRMNNFAQATDADYFYVELADGSQGKMKKSSLASLIVPGGTLNGIFIMFHRKSDDFPLMVNPHKWTSYQNSGEIASGVVLVEGGKCLVIAPTEAPNPITWSSAAISGGGVTTSDRLTAINDWAGKVNTAAQIAASNSSAVTNTASYAPGFCNLYSRVNANNKGLTAGKWWLPSVGEMLAIYANIFKINYALSLISGASPLAEAPYWASSEYSEAVAWFFNLNAGYVDGYTKASVANRVRPVSAFIF